MINSNGFFDKCLWLGDWELRLLNRVNSPTFKAIHYVGDLVDESFHLGLLGTWAHPSQAGFALSVAAGLARAPDVQIVEP